MAQIRPCFWSVLGLVVLAAPALAQDEHRIWGRVVTTDGDAYEGFIRWDRNEGSWVDILDGSKDVPDENYQVWLRTHGEEPAIRTIELRGYRISWPEDDPDFPSSTRSGIRFGHLSALTVLGRDRIEVELRTGETLELSGGSTDIGWSIREIVVDRPGEEELELDWDDLDRIDFSAAPPRAVARSPRLYGTVEDIFGRSFTGYLSWDLDEIFEADVLDGDEIDGGDDRRIPFGDIASIERIEDGSRVLLHSGTVLELDGSNDVDRGHRGVQVSDPALGMVEVEWSEMHLTRFHAADDPASYDRFAASTTLTGTVVTQAGEEIYGTVRWDADEGSGWELVTGRSDDVVFTIELGLIDRIERGEAFGSRVTLVDGRSFELEDDRDVDWDNKGVLVAPETADPTDPGSWRLIPWEDFHELRFSRPANVDGRAR